MNLKHIKELHLEPTSVCNAACPQCPRTFGDLPNPFLRINELTIADVKRIFPVEFVQQLDKMFMCGNYGDPAAARDAVKIFEYFKSNNNDIVLGMNTNGSLRTTEFWKDVAQIQTGIYDYVVWSIDGLEDTNHIYRRNTIWSKIMHNLSAYIDAGGSAHWDMLVFPHNAHQVDAAIDLAKELGCTWFRSKQTVRPVHESTPWLTTFPVEVRDYNNATTSCQALNEQSVYVSSTGEWFPCCYIASYADVGTKKGITLSDDYPVDNRTIDLYNTHFVRTVFGSFNSSTQYPVCTESCSTCPNGKSVAKSQWKNEIQLR